MSFIRHSRFVPFKLLAVVAIGLSCTSLHATIWDGGPGGTGTELGTAANWVGDVLPSVNGGLGEFDGTVNTSLSLNYTTGFAGAAGNDGLNLSMLAGQSGSLSIDSGTSTTSLRLDDVTLAGTGAFTVGNGSDTFNITLGGDSGQAHTWTNNSTAAATINSEVVFGLGGGGNHPMDLNGSGTWNVNNTIGGTLNLSLRATGTGIVNLNGSITTSGVANIHVSSTSGIPVVNLSSGTINLSNVDNGSLLIGNLQAGGMGVFNQSGGSITVQSNVLMGSAPGATNYGFFNKTGGTLTQNANDRFRIGQGAGNGSANLFYHSGGSTSTTVGIALNDTAGATAGTGGAAVLYVTSGSMTSTVAGMGLGIGGRLGQSEVTIADTGTVTLTGSTTLGGSVAGTPAAGDANRIAVLNLVTGGTLQTSQVNQNATAGALPVGYLNFNNGTLRSQTANASYLTGLTQATVHSGGGTIDNNGVAITIGQNLVAPTGNGVTTIGVSGTSGYKGAPYVQITGGGTPTTPATAVANLDGSGNVTSITVTNPGSGYTSAPTVTLVGGGGTAGTLTPSVGATSSGGMTFTGGGTTTLTGANTYTGATTVNGSILSVTGSIHNSSAVTVSSGTLDGTGSVGPTSISSGATVANGAGGTNDLALSSLTLASGSTATVKVAQTTPTVAGLAVTGALSTSSGITLNASTDTGVWNNGLINLISFGSFPVGSIGDFTLSALSGLTSRQTNQELVLNGSNIAIQIDGDSPRWTGLDDGNWAVGLTGTNKNWKLVTANTPTDYLEGDTVLFDDTVTTGTTSIDLGSNVSPGSTTFQNSSKNYTIGSVGGFSILTGSLSKSGTGLLTINTANTYTGGTTFNGGTLNVGNGSALGNGTLTIGTGAAKTLNNTSGGAMALSTITSQAWNDDFTFTGTNDLDMGTGAVTLGGTSSSRSVTISGGILTVGRILGAAHGLTKAGTGTLTILTPVTDNTAPSNITGDLNVVGGSLSTLNIGANDFIATGLTGDGTIANGSGTTRWLIVNNTTDKTFSGSLQNGAGAGTVGFRKGGIGTQTLSGSNSYTDRTTLDAGTLVISGANSGAGTNAFINAGTMVLANTSALGTSSTIRVGGSNLSTVAYATDGGDNLNALSFGSGTDMTIVSNRATPGAGINHTMTTLGANDANNNGPLGGGIITVTSGANVTSGAGRITFADVFFGSGAVNSTTFNPTTANVTLGNVSKTLNAPNQTLGLGGTTADNHVTGVIANGTTAAIVSVLKNGGSTWTLSGANTYTGGTTIDAGTLLVNNTSGFGTGTGTVTVNSGGTLGGTGTINTSSTNASVTINAGGNLAPGASAGTLTFALGTGSLIGSAMSPGGLKFELATPSTSDKVVLTSGTLTLGQLDFADFAFTPLSGLAAGTYTLFDAASTMATTIGSASGTIGSFNATLSTENTTDFNVYLTLTPGAGLLGDFNSDGKVDAGDYVTWRKNNGTNNALANDNSLGVPVGPAHYNLWRANFGNPPGSGSAVGGNAAVPEPTTCVLTILVGIWVLATRRRFAAERRTRS